MLHRSLRPKQTKNSHPSIKLLIISNPSLYKVTTDTNILHFLNFQQINLGNKCIVKFIVDVFD